MTNASLIVYNYREMKRKTRLKLRRFKTQLHDKLVQTKNNTTSFIKVNVSPRLNKLAKIILKLTRKVKTFIMENQELSFLIISGLIILVVITYSENILHPPLVIEDEPTPLATEPTITILSAEAEAPEDSHIELTSTDFYDTLDKIGQYINFQTNFHFKHSWAATQPIEYDVVYDEPITKENLEQMKSEAQILFDYICRVWNDKSDNDKPVKIRLMVNKALDSEIVIYTLENFEMKL